MSQTGMPITEQSNRMRRPEAGSVVFESSSQQVRRSDFWVPMLLSPISSTLVAIWWEHSLIVI